MKVNGRTVTLMARLIDANEIRERIRHINSSVLSNEDAVLIMRMIDEQPTVDSVQVVRCKDCEHYCQHESTKGFCTLHSTFEVDSFTLERMYELEDVSENDYCWKAVRKGR